MIETVERLEVVRQLEVVKWFYTMMGRISIVFIEVIFAINPLLMVHCLVPVTPGHTLYKKFIAVRACVHAQLFNTLTTSWLCVLNPMTHKPFHAINISYTVKRLEMVKHPAGTSIVSVKCNTIKSF